LSPSLFPHFLSLPPPSGSAINSAFPSIIFKPRVNPSLSSPPPCWLTPSHSMRTFFFFENEKARQKPVLAFYACSSSSRLPHPKSACPSIDPLKYSVPLMVGFQIFDRRVCLQGKEAGIMGRFFARDSPSFFFHFPFP